MGEGSKKKIKEWGDKSTVTNGIKREVKGINQMWYYWGWFGRIISGYEWVEQECEEMNVKL